MDTETDPIRCGCPGAPLWRPLLIERGIARACMTCGAIRLAVTEWSYPDNPHAEPQLVATRVLELDAEAEAWLAAFPRVAALPGPDPCFFSATTRAPDEAALVGMEAELARAAQAAGMGARLRLAGIPGPPPRPDLRMALEPFVQVRAALDLTPESPLGDALALAACSTALAARIANEALAARPALLAELAAALAAGAPPRPLVLDALSRAAPAAPDAEARALASSLNDRLTALCADSFEHEIELDAIVRLLQALGARAAPARGAVSLLAESELASRRSVLRDAIARLFAALGPAAGSVF
ncbi:MAG: hypothetical protein U0263_36225 [Polyangiaceae bacterium]